MSLDASILEKDNHIFMVVNGHPVTIAGAFEHNGVPYINGKRAAHDPPKPGDEVVLLDGAFSSYRCPECNARLSGQSKPSICLNGCHFTSAQQSRFSALMASAVARVNRRNRLKEGLGLLGELAVESATDDELGL